MLAFGTTLRQCELIALAGCRFTFFILMCFYLVKIQNQQQKKREKKLNQVKK